MSFLNRPGLCVYILYFAYLLSSDILFCTQIGNVVIVSDVSFLLFGLVVKLELRWFLVLEVKRLK